jgi:hypothetical protein
MKWHHSLAYFVGGAFLVNAVPHLVAGVLGRPLPTPFAPPGQGESSALVNVLWAAFNVVIGYLLVGRVGHFQPRRTADALTLGLGGLLMAIMLALTFGPLYGGT